MPNTAHQPTVSPSLHHGKMAAEFRCNAFSKKGIEMQKLTVSLAALSLLSGCASTLDTFYNRPVVEDNVEKAISTVSLSADRRTVVVVTEGENRTRFCAEPPPDSARNVTTELKASMDAEAKSQRAQAEGKVKGDLSDKLTTNVVVLSERTAALDAYRTGIYALCQYHLNGAIEAKDVKPMFEKLIEGFFGKPAQ